jgi:hypothetical protein
MVNSRSLQRVDYGRICGICNNGSSRNGVLRNQEKIGYKDLQNEKKKEEKVGGKFTTLL